MARTTDTKQRLREAQRTRILDAAGKVFARKGLAATMDDIAVEASVSHGLAYRYFAGKEDIFYALIEQAVQAPSSALERFQEMPGTAAERLDHLITELVESRRYPEMYQLLGQVLGDEAAPDDLRQLLHRRAEALKGVLKELIVEGQATGEVAADDPEQLVWAVFATLEGLTAWAAHDPVGFEEHFPDARIFLRMLKPS